MKKILVFGLIPFISFGAIPNSADGWWTPQGGYSDSVIQWAGFEQGGKWYECAVDEYGGDVMIEWMGLPPKEPNKTAIEKALSAYSLAVYNEERIKALGENLNAVFSTDGITITGTTPDGSTQSYTLKFTKNGGLGNDSGTLQATTDHMKWNLADERSLHLLKGNKIEIFGWSNIRAGNDPLFLAKTSSGLQYIPILNTLTNDVSECDCTNKWKKATAWIGDGEQTTDDLTFESANLESFLKTEKHFVKMNGGTEGTEYSFTLADGGVTASFDAPQNWVDDKSLERNSGGHYEIKNFSRASACNASLSTMLTDENDSNRSQHLFLANVNGNLHYVPIGDTIEFDRDGRSLTLNSEGKLEMSGFEADALDGYFPMKKNGVLTWAPTNAIQKVDTIGNFAFKSSTRRIQGGVACFGRTYVKVAGMTVREGYTGGILLRADMETKTAHLQEGDAFDFDPELTVSYIPIYEFSGGEILTDYRGAPVIQMWE